LLAIAIVYLVAMFFGHLPDHLILFPTRGPTNAGGAVRKIIPFENGQLEVWIAQSQLARSKGNADIYVLRFYGNADRAERWPAAEAEMWNDRAIEIWGVNYPGFGGSTGPVRLTRIGPAAVAASRPAGIAGLILQNPPPLREMILRRFGWWNLWLLAGPVALQIPKDLDSIANAKAIHTPAIFLLAEKDEVVSPRYHRLVVEAYAGEKRVISLRGAYHNDPIEGSALAELYHGLEWLLAKKSSPSGL
jgi:hypothetical protein